MIGSLLFLRLQVRQSNKLAHAEAVRSYANDFNEHVMSPLVDPDIADMVRRGNNEMARIYRVGGQSPQDLTDDERVRFGFILLSAFRVHETIYFQEKAGSGEGTLWKTEIGTMRFHFSFPSVLEWWQTNPISMTPEFRNFVEEDVLTGTEPPS